MTHSSGPARTLSTAETHASDRDAMQSLPRRGARASLRKNDVRTSKVKCKFAFHKMSGEVSKSRQNERDALQICTERESRENKARHREDAQEPAGDIVRGKKTAQGRLRVPQDCSRVRFVDSRHRRQASQSEKNDSQWPVARR